MTIGRIDILQRNHIPADTQKSFATVTFDQPHLNLLYMGSAGANGAPAPTWKVDGERKVLPMMEDVLLEIRRNNQDVPVIGLADYPFRQYRRKYVEAGADFFFDKSTEFDGVMAELKRLGRIDAAETTDPGSRDGRIDSRKKGDKRK